MSTVKADYLVNAAGTGAPTFTNGAVLPAGSAAAPAISPTGNSNTGIFFPAADTIAFSEGGTEAMRIDSAGLVGIGTAPSLAKLHVLATASQTAALFTGGGTYQGFAIQNNQSSASVYGGTYYDARNELGNCVANFLGDINTDGSSGWTWTTQSAGTRLDRRADAMRLTGTGLLQFNSGYGSVATAYGCRAWVIFAGASGTVAGSGNVTSVSRAAAGNYTINFTTAMPNTNYCITGVSSGSSTGSTSISAAGASGDFGRSTGSVQVFSVDASGNANVDAVTVCVAIFR
jgi:hypothetical protein